jgi:hypothetical protein
VSGTVGVVADVAGRYNQFSQCLTQLHIPVNTAIDWRFGSDRGVSRNKLVRAMLDRGSEWIWFVDDDQAFPPTILRRMLQHEQPVVSALYVQRSKPFLPIAYKEKRDGAYWPLNLQEHGPNELVQVVGVGTGGLLVRSEVFRQLGDVPWFVHTTGQSEDLYFCDLCAEAGIPVHVDTGARLGHFAPAVVFPEWDTEEGNERWVAGIQFSDSTQFIIEMDHSYDEPSS